jgi:kynurenine formamidase
MCSPEIMAKVASVTRRSFVRRSGALGLTAGVMGIGGWSATRAQDATPEAPPAQQMGPGMMATPGGMMGGPMMNGMFSSILDLTHTWGPDFPMYPGAEQPTFEVIVTIESGGFFKSKLTLDEHTGTHMDAPIHFAEDGASADMLAPENFIAPLVVVDISGRAASDPDAQGMVDDILAWESEHGALPAGAFVALNAGWDAMVDDPESYLNLDAEGVPHFPGWHPDATAMLVNERDIVGMGVDTVSLDFGASTDFGTHLTLLPAGKFGIENLANLGSAPASGAWVIIGGPKHVNASGGPSRVLAFV